MLKCQKFSQPAGGYPPPRNPPPGTLPPGLNPFGVDTYGHVQNNRSIFHTHLGIESEIS